MTGSMILKSASTRILLNTVHNKVIANSAASSNSKQQYRSDKRNSTAESDPSTAADPFYADNSSRWNNSQRFLNEERDLRLFGQQKEAFKLQQAEQPIYKYNSELGYMEIVQKKES